VPKKHYLCSDKRQNDEEDSIDDTGGRYPDGMQAGRSGG
jgi:hypothetical protein